MNTLIINSAKGGVGKSMVTSLIATELSKTHSVAIIDLDVSTPNIGSDFKDGIQIISPVTPRQMTKRQIETFIRKSIKGLKEIDYLLIDTPPTLNDSYTAIVEVIRHAKILYVTTPSKNAVKDTGIGIRYFKARGIDPIGVVQNMVGEVFGEVFDTDEEYGLPTIGVIPLSKDLTNVDLSWVSKIEDARFSTTSITSDDIIFSKLTIDEVEKDEGLPLKFYNLETWDVMRDRILDADELPFCGFERSRYDVSTEELEKIITEGSSTNVLIKEGMSVQNAPMRWEIQEAQIVYDNPVSKGLPMFLLDSGTYLWSQEVSLADDSMIKDYLEEEAFDLGGGRIVPSLFYMIYLGRAFERDFDLDKTANLAKRYIDEVPSIDKRYIIRTFASLEHIPLDKTSKVGGVDFDEWDTAEFALTDISIDYTLMLESIFTHLEGNENAK